MIIFATTYLYMKQMNENEERKISQNAFAIYAVTKRCGYEVPGMIFM
jgi:hypothetical protein